MSPYRGLPGLQQEAAVLEKFAQILGFAWRRTGDASVLAWLFPSAWSIALPVLPVIGTAIIAVIYGIPPVLWIPSALAAAALVLICAVYYRAFRDPNFGRVAPKSGAALEDADLKKQASKWLITKLSEQKFHVQQAALFGSIVHDHFRTSDVDVIVRFKPISDSAIKKSVRRIKSQLAQDFKQKFGHDLHIKFFLTDELPGYDTFAANTKHEEII
jgi:predicted nucleotidyltransferase